MHKRLKSGEVLRGVQVVALGEAEGHDFTITEEFLDRVVELGNQSPVKVRVNHPEGRGDVLSIAGEATNFRLDGECVRADITLFDVPDKHLLTTLAQQAGHLFGMSLDFGGEVVKKAGQKLKTMTCEAIYALDFVDTPAATHALFAAGKDKAGRHRTLCAFDQVDLKPKVRTDDMTKTLLNKLCKKYGIDPKAEDVEKQLSIKLEEAEAHPEPDGDEGNPIDAVMAKLEGIEERLTKLEGGDDEDKVELEDEPVVEDEDKEEAMAAMAAKVCSIMLAKVGVRPRASIPEAEADSGEHQLSADDLKIAKQLNMGDEERKQFAANLARAKQVKL